MSTEVVNPTNNALAAAAALKRNLQKARAQIPDTQNMAYLRFGRDGVWVFGVDNDEVFEDDVIAINTLSIKTGYSCWTDRPKGGGKNEIMGEVMVALGQPAVVKADLPVHKDPQNGGAVCEWKEQSSADFKFMSGPHKGKQVHYSTTSRGGLSAMSALIDQIILQVDEDRDNIVPRVTLSDDNYPHKQYGKVYVPIIKIVGWQGLEDGAEAAPAEEKKAVEKPEPNQEPEDDGVVEGTATEQTEAPVEEEAAPVRRRRRR